MTTQRDLERESLTRRKEVFREKLRALSDEALEVIAEVLRSDREERASDRLRAAEYVIDQAWGRAAAPEQPLSLFTGLDAERIIIALERRRRLPLTRPEDGKKALVSADEGD